MVQPAPQASPSGALAPVPQPGDTIDGAYRVERVLGQGGMGVVLAAVQLGTQQRVAVKVLTPEAAASPESRARFTREARAASSIPSEHVPKILAVGAHGHPEIPYMVMEYLEGEDLGHHLLRVGRLAVAEAVDDVMQACEAVAHAHKLGIVHRDLKPANLFLARQADGRTVVKVLDFGISKLTEPGSDVALTATSFAFGTPMYMSPEQVRSTKHVDPRTDLWAIGIILHELLTGRPPFDGDTLTALCASITADEPRRLRAERPDAPAGLEAAILWCLQKRAEARPGSVLALATSLSPFGSGRSRELLARIERIGAVELPALSGPVAFGDITRPTRTPTSLRRTIALATLATLAAGVTAAMLVSRLAPASRPPEPAPSASAVEAPSAWATTPEPSVSSAAAVVPPVASSAPSARPGRPVIRNRRNDVQDDRH